MLPTCVALALLTSTLLSAQDPWDAKSLLSPDQFASQLKSEKPAPRVIFVGFSILYKGAHIPGATFAGPCSKPEGIDLLLKQTAALQRDTEIVIYCGCCPFVRCPNVRPAYRALKAAGFTRIKVLELDSSLHDNWVQKGYPTDK
jgi:thiosulfate/3-mercaptopyruvate sulfurtransferase